MCRQMVGEGICFRAFAFSFKRACLSDTDTCRRVPNGLEHHNKHSSQDGSGIGRVTGETQS